MKLHILTCLLLLTAATLPAQQPDTWTSFWNKDTTLMGFKDKNGVVKIEPRFSGLTTAGQFENITAVMEERDGKWSSYYLTKSGRIVGHDSLYIFDFTPDCENEGFIRFHDRKTDKQGLFNKNGDIAIPAAYNYLSMARNGLVAALTGATKKQMGEHHSWEGGKLILTDTNNNVLIDNFTSDLENINYYSLQVTDHPVKDSIRDTFKGVNGRFYSFINYDKEFLSWLRTALLEQFTKNTLLNSSYDKIFYWKEPEGWTSEPKNSFINRNFELIKARLLVLNTKDCDYNIFDEHLNPYTYNYESTEYKHYFNNCGQSKNWIYPVKNVVIDHHIKKELKQDHFEFLRTANGYKLIKISVPSIR